MLRGEWTCGHGSNDFVYSLHSACQISIAILRFDKVSSTVLMEIRDALPIDVGPTKYQMDLVHCREDLLKAIKLCPNTVYVWTPCVSLFYGIDNGSWGVL